MAKIIVIGKGKEWESVVKKIGKKNLYDKDLDNKAYDAELERTFPMKDGFIPAALDELQANQQLLMKYDKIYIFPDELPNGMEMIAFFHQLGVCPIYVITHQSRFSNVYKKLGASYVIMANQENHGYGWLFQEDVG